MLIEVDANALRFSLKVHLEGASVFIWLAALRFFHLGAGPPFLVASPLN